MFIICILYVCFIHVSAHNIFFCYGRVKVLAEIEDMMTLLNCLILDILYIFWKNTCLSISLTCEPVCSSLMAQISCAFVGQRYMMIEDWGGGGGLDSRRLSPEHFMKIESREFCFSAHRTVFVINFRLSMPPFVHQFCKATNSILTFSFPFCFFN